MANMNEFDTTMNAWEMIWRCRSKSALLRSAPIHHLPLSLPIWHWIIKFCAHAKHLIVFVRKIQISTQSWITPENNNLWLPYSYNRRLGGIILSQGSCIRRKRFGIYWYQHTNLIIVIIIIIYEYVIFIIIILLYEPVGTFGYWPRPRPISWLLTYICIFIDGRICCCKTEAKWRDRCEKWKEDDPGKLLRLSS